MLTRWAWCVRSSAGRYFISMDHTRLVACKSTQHVHVWYCPAAAGCLSKIAEGLKLGSTWRRGNGLYWEVTRQHSSFGAIEGPPVSPSWETFRGVVWQRAACRFYLASCRCKRFRLTRLSPESIAPSFTLDAPTKLGKSRGFGGRAPIVLLKPPAKPFRFRRLFPWTSAPSFPHSFHFLSAGKLSRNIR